MKCHHCGEFLDGRKQEEAAAQKQQGLTFVIEKAIIQTDRAGLPGGEQSPLLESPRRERIEGPRKQIEGPQQLIEGPKAKDEDSIIDAEPVTSSERTPRDEPRRRSADSGEDSPRRESKELVPTQARKTAEDKSAAVRTEGGAREVIVRDYAASLPAKLAPLFNRGKSKKAEPATADDTIDVRPASDEDKYRLCTVCQTEILVDDNYCFHCGQKYHSGEFEAKPKLKEHSVALHYALIAILACAQVVAPIMIESNRAPGASRLAFGIAAIGIPLVCVAAFFWKRKFLNQGFSLMLLAASVVASLIFWPE